MKASMSGLLISHREKISCVWHFQTVVLKTVLLRIVVSIYVMKILAKESKLLSLCSLPADVLWGSFVTHSFLPHGRLLNRDDFYVLDCLNKPISG